MKEKNILRLISFAALLACMLLTLPSCILKQNPSNPEDKPKIYILLSNTDCDYGIVYQSTDEAAFFEHYAHKFFGRCAVDYNVLLEEYSSEEKEAKHEILFGDTDRPLSTELKARVEEAGGADGDLAWGYAYKDGKLAFYANSEIAAELGFAELSSVCFKDGGVAVSHDLFTVNTKSLSEYEDEQNKKDEPPAGEQVELVIKKNEALLSLYPSAESGIAGSIRGEHSSYVLSLPSRIVLHGDLLIDNITISGSCTVIANGYKFEVSKNVTSKEASGRLTVYGGKDSGTLKGDTNLVLLGGKYDRIYGGGSNSDVIGNTNITLGGNANIGDGIDDSASNISPCKIYGGGRGGSVSGTAEITLKDSAVTKYIVGTGTGSSGTKVRSVKINIQGGRVMNVIGAAENEAADDIDVHIYVTGGLIESVFGGCQAASMSGSVDISLMGGDISRRVYAGCYNDYGFWNGFTTKHSVNGYLTVTVGPNVKLASGTELSGDNASDMGIFASSRLPSASSSEIGRVIFLDGCYSSQRSNLGPAGWISASPKSFHIYEIDCSAGGNVYSFGPKQLLISPSKGYKCTVGEKAYYYNSSILPIDQNLYTLPDASSITRISVNFSKE